MNICINCKKYPVFAKHLCKYCQHLRTDKKPTILKRKPIKKVSLKQNQLLGERRLQQKKDWLFFISIWEERPHVDFETDEYISGEPLTLYFHHVLSKSKYPQFRYCKWNIVIVTWATHSKAETNIEFVPKIKAYRNELLKSLNSLGKSELI